MMDRFYLEKVSTNRKYEIIEYIREFYKYNSRINGVGRLQDFVTEEDENFDEWIRKIEDEESASLPKFCYLFIRCSDNKLIGMTNIRMSNDLGDYEFGHVGYSIRPTERNKGYGKMQFYLALQELRKNNIHICQMNCNSDNAISRNVIQSLGGSFEKNIDDEEYYLINVEEALNNNRDKYEVPRREDDDYGDR